MASKKAGISSSSRFGIKSLDVLGSKFTIGYPTATGKLQTTLGGYLTILMGLLSTTMFVIVMSQFFNNDSPVVMTSSEFGSQVTVYDLYTQNLYPIIALYIGPKQIPASQISRYVTIKAFVDSIIFKPDAEADASLEFTRFRVFDYKTCGARTHWLRSMSKSSPTNLTSKNWWRVRTSKVSKLTSR